MCCREQGEIFDAVENLHGSCVARSGAAVSAIRILRICVPPVLSAVVLLTPACMIIVYDFIARFILARISFTTDSTPSAGGEQTGRGPTSKQCIRRNATCRCARARRPQPREQEHWSTTSSHINSDTSVERHACIGHKRRDDVADLLTYCILTSALARLRATHTHCSAACRRWMLFKLSVL